jgi:predicted acyltransferase
MKERLVSLDAFRGATIALMVVVNSPGDAAHAYAPLKHAEWHGWTPTDVVFPSFLWIVGVAITLSLAKRVASGVPRSRLFLQVLRRSAILYCLGLLLYGFPKYDLSTLRLLGVLQRIAICYAIAAAIYLTHSRRGQVAWIAGLLVSYWMLMTLVPVPGYGPGRLDEAGNLAHYVDRVVLGAHNYAETRTYDPEGIVSTLPAIATTLFGVMAGHILRLRRDLAERATWLFFAGAILIAAGLILEHWMPINKKIWTVPFALFMGGLDFTLFAMFLWAVDGAGWKRPVRPLAILGMNAIAVYMAAEVVEAVLWSFDWRKPLYNAVFAPLPIGPYNSSLAFSLALLALMFAVAWVMHRRNWILRV